MVAATQCPLAKNERLMVAAIPIDAKEKRNFFLEALRSAMAPRKGAAMATIIPAREFARPSRAVLREVSVPKLQNCLKKIGKNPAMTVVAKAEFAQSYMAQAMICFLETCSKAAPPAAFSFMLSSIYSFLTRISPPVKGEKKIMRCLHSDYEHPCHIVYDERMQERGDLVVHSLCLYPFGLYSPALATEQGIGWDHAHSRATLNQAGDVQA